MPATALSTVILDAALVAAAEGLRVYPVNRATKRPATPHGFLDATRDPDVLATWFAPRGRYARCGIGYATGAASGAWALDVDGRHGGFAALAALELRHGRLPETATTATPSGGLHLHFRHPGGVVKSTVSVVGPGLDVRGDRSCTTIPPTTRPDGRRYTWLRPWSALADAPAWLVALVREPECPALPAVPPALAPSGGTAYGRKALSGELDRIRAAVNGTRDNTVNAASFAVAQLVAGGEVDQTGVEDALVVAAMDAGLPERQVRSTVASGFRAGLRSPRRRRTP